MFVYALPTTIKDYMYNWLKNNLDKFDEMDYHFNLDLDYYIDDLSVEEIKDLFNDMNADVYYGIECSNDMGFDLPTFRNKKHFYAYSLLLFLQYHFPYEEIVNQYINDISDDETE